MQDVRTTMNTTNPGADIRGFFALQSSTTINKNNNSNKTSDIMMGPPTLERAPSRKVLGELCDNSKQSTPPKTSIKSSSIRPEGPRLSAGILMRVSIPFKLLILLLVVSAWINTIHIHKPGAFCWKSIFRIICINIIETTQRQPITIAGS
jgi:hypothetical protein